MDYNYIVNDSLDLESIDRLRDSLRERYCQTKEYELMKAYGVKVVWRYWNKAGILLKTIKSATC